MNVRNYNMSASVSDDSITFNQIQRIHAMFEHDSLSLLVCDCVCDYR